MNKLDNQLPAGWEINKLGEVCDIIGGGTPAKNIAKFYEGNILWATVRDMKSEIISETEFKISEEAVQKSSTNIIPKGNVIIATRVGLGKTCLIQFDTAINQDLRGVIPKKSKQLDVGYLFQWFKSISHLIIQEGTGATVQGVKLPFIKDLPIPLPPLPEQQRIVTILDEAFAAIAKAKANAEQNRQNAKALFESYLQGVFENGKGIWEEKTLDEVCEFRNGAAHEQYIDESGKYILVNSKFISANGEKFKRTNSALAPLFVNDIAFVMSDVPNGKALAKCFLVNKNNTYTLNQRIGAIKSKVLIPEFLVYQFNRNKYLLNFNNGENQTNLRKGDILKCPLWVPSKEDQQTIVRQLDTLRTETQKLEEVYQQKIYDLDELKKSILQMAFAGELKTEKEMQL